ncbi:unnamed protein product [Rhodiola kirilowii]
MVNALDVSKPENDKRKNPIQQPCFLCSSTKHTTGACPDGKYEDDEDVCEETHYVNQHWNYAPNLSPPTRNYEPPQRRMSNNPDFPSKPQGQNEKGVTKDKGMAPTKIRGKILNIPTKGTIKGPYQAKPPMNDQGTSHQQGRASSNTQDNAMMSMMAQMLENQKETNKRMEQLEAHNKMLENQSGRVLPTPQGKPSPNDKEIEAEVANKNSEVELQAPTEEEKKEEEPVLTRHYVPRIPFPQRLNKSKLDAHFQRFVEMLKKLYVTLPFHEVIAQNPTYAKFLKDIVSNRRVIEESSMVALNVECSAIVQSRMPKKMQDHGPFSIPISLGKIETDRALCDLGASISLIPYSLFEKIDVGELHPTTISLKLADTSSRIPRGVLRDVSIKVGKFFIPVDFYVLEMDDEQETPVILGRPFLNTVEAVIRCGEGSIELKIGNEKLKKF